MTAATTAATITPTVTATAPAQTAPPVPAMAEETDATDIMLRSWCIVGRMSRAKTLQIKCGEIPTDTGNISYRTDSFKTEVLEI